MPTTPDTLTLTAVVHLTDYHPEPLTTREAIERLDNDGYLTTTISLDMDTFAEMSTSSEAFTAETDTYTRLAALQVHNGDAYDSSYNVRFFDPATNLVYVEVTNGLGDRMAGLGHDLATPEGRDACIADFDG